ncbi:hypothetical protein Bca101_060433 [Brassica carinata]
MTVVHPRWRYDCDSQKQKKKKAKRVGELMGVDMLIHDPKAALIPATVNVTVCPLLDIA